MTPTSTSTDTTSSTNTSTSTGTSNNLNANVSPDMAASASGGTGAAVDPATAELLAQLAPIAQPPPPPAWPPGPGWWLLAGALVLAAIAAGWATWRWYQRRAYRRLALAELDRLPADAPTHAVLELLKRTARAACPAAARHIGGLYGAAFGETLRAALPQPQQGDALVRAAQQAYTAHNSGDTELRASAALWIRTHSIARLRRAVPEASASA